MRMMMGAAGAIALLTLSACGPDTRSMRVAMPTAEVPANSSRLVVYRYTSELVEIEANVRIDGQPTCGIRPGEVIAWELPPGGHQLAVDFDAGFGVSVIDAPTKAGQTTIIAAYRNAKAIVAGAVFGVLGAAAASDRLTPRGSQLFLEPPTPEVAAQEMAELTMRNGCPTPGGRSTVRN